MKRLTVLARDIDRYLQDLPVEACPPSTVYRLRKFVRRNRGAAFAATAVLAALVVGIVGTSVGMMRAQVERDRAIDAEEKERFALQERRTTIKLRARLLTRCLRRLPSSGWRDVLL